jgi:photosystem II stability/assembly factor-like uncharacterized protein
MAWLWMALLVPLGVFAQTQPALLNDGRPMRVEGRCTGEDIERLGMTCTAEEPCGLLLELTGVEPIANRIILSGNLHTASATLSSILLTSEDGGRTWTEPFERIPAAALDQIQFLDYEYGWIGGQYLVTVPKDPFFLLTTDGGKSWRRSPVFSETRAGAIERFRFTSRADGKLWIDRTQAGEAGLRHEFYETLTGGSSWMLRQASDQPIPGDRAEPPSGNADWRLRADGATKSYRVERRQGERWQTVASFLIAAGECRAQEQIPVEPPAAIR